MNLSFSVNILKVESNEWMDTAKKGYRAVTLYFVILFDGGKIWPSFIVPIY